MYRTLAATIAFHATPAAADPHHLIFTPHTFFTSPLSPSPLHQSSAAPVITADEIAITAAADASRASRGGVRRQRSSEQFRAAAGEEAHDAAKRSETPPSPRKVHFDGSSGDAVVASPAAQDDGTLKPFSTADAALSIQTKFSPCRQPHSNHAAEATAR